MPTRGLRWKAPPSPASPPPRGCWRPGSGRGAPSPVKYVLLVHLAATLVMVGIIWFVQIVHYPLFGNVGTGGFSAYSEAHTRLTGFVVGPPMLAEAATSILLVIIRPQAIPAGAAWTGLLLVACIWLSTA